MGRHEELIPPDDPRFEGAQFISADARIAYTVEQSSFLQAAVWHWAEWKERPATAYDPTTGEEWLEVWDHDHCHFCYDTAFSERYDNDLREGWTTAGPRGGTPEEQMPNYHWVCPPCFEQYRRQFGWTTE